MELGLHMRIFQKFPPTRYPLPEERGETFYTLMLWKRVKLSSACSKTQVVVHIRTDFFFIFFRRAPKLFLKKHFQPKVKLDQLRSFQQFARANPVSGDVSPASQPASSGQQTPSLGTCPFSFRYDCSFPVTCSCSRSNGVLFDHLFCKPQAK